LIAAPSALAGGHNGNGHHGANGNHAKKLAKAVTVPGILRHELAFQAIADANDDTRASGTPGFGKSADYVARKLTKAGYEVTRQPFDFAFFTIDSPSEFSRVAPTPTTYVEDDTFSTMDYSGSGDVTATVQAVDVTIPMPQDAPASTSNSGCEAADFAGFTPGNIALVQRGTCTFALKAQNAAAAGAVGVVVFNEGQAPLGRDGLLFGTLGGPVVNIPVFGISYALGVELTAPGTTLRMFADTTSEIRTTENIIAESKKGDDSNVVMAGAHLDSVLEGPGINDNGSGSAALLEVALQMAKEKPKNTVRFAWWGAEENNLLGSTHYVDNLTAEQADAIALYLNFDMIASPNYMLAIYDGDDSDATGAGPGPAGSAEIEDVFEAFFASRGLPTKGTDFDGRSDYGPFIAAGIPAGGLFTGAEGAKSAEDAAKWGGVVGEQYDPCYHQGCDSFTPVRDGADADLYSQLRRPNLLVGNLSTKALDVNADAIATAVATFAYDTSMLPSAAATTLTAQRLAVTATSSDAKSAA
jgi:Zn-dependent M28 family amino/carboxypeptidase